ncbi:hypothetical protein CATMIT_01664, partial [Catenibacterium mitsuokai DSM 15897]
TTSSWPTMAWAMAARSSPSRASCACSSAPPFVSSLLITAPETVRCADEESRVQRIHHDVDPELGVVLGQEALVAPVVVPFAAVVLVAVQQPEAPVDLDAFKVIVDQIVAPAVEFETGRRRPVEDEEAAVDRMVLRQLLQRLGAEDLGHLRLERLGEQAVDVVVAIVDEH